MVGGTAEVERAGEIGLMNMLRFMAVACVIVPAFAFGVPNTECCVALKSSLDSSASNGGVELLRACFMAGYPAYRPPQKAEGRPPYMLRRLQIKLG